MFMCVATATFLGRARPPCMALPGWVPAELVSEISEPEAQAAFENMQTAELTLPADLATGPVTTTYLKTAVEPDALRPPVVLIHGFDISCLEWRRLLPRLEAAGIEAYAPCVAGWGFTDTTNMRTVGAAGKRAQLLAFWETVLGSRPAVWVGASLGACIALDVYTARPAAVQSFATLAPGFFTPPPPTVPAPVGRLLLQNVLSAPGVRRSIAKQVRVLPQRR
jgi:pimeloyl-ACP methyl ester carboxylesterase